MNNGRPAKFQLVDEVLGCYRVVSMKTWRNPAPGSGWTAREMTDVRQEAIGMLPDNPERSEVVLLISQLLDRTVPAKVRRMREDRARKEGQEHEHDTP